MSPLTEQPQILPSPSVDAKAADRLANLRGVILLDGSVRASDLANAAGRSTLELPVANGTSVLDLWRKQIADLADSIGLEKLPCRLLLGHASRPPALSPEDLAAGFTVERDGTEFRGTGGALRDLLAESQEDSAQFLVAGAAQILLEPLPILAAEAAAKGGEVTLVAYDDGSLSNLSLIQRSAVRRIPTHGFIDLKEKGLAMIAAGHQVTVLRRPRATSAPLRSLSEYITALQEYHRVARRENLRQPPFEEKWSSTFSITERGSLVAPGARLHDSVVLSGGCVGVNSVVVRSVVCPGGSIAPGRRVAEGVINKPL
jgi:hypothetical protein